MNIKPEDSWLESVLFTLALAGPIGESERRHWRDPQYKEFYTSLWRESPRWFREAARPYLDKRYQAKAKPKGMMNSEILKAIEHFSSNKSLDSSAQKS